MKINWGSKIVIVYSILVSGMILLVYLSSRENKDLVTENYYAEEIAYQKIIDYSKNTAALSKPVEVKRINNKIEIVFPAELSNLKTEGTWLLYFSADKLKDINGNFSSIDGNLNIDIPKNTFGLYQLKINWKSGEKDYYFEKELTL